MKFKLQPTHSSFPFPHPLYKLTLHLLAILFIIALYLLPARADAFSPYVLAKTSPIAEKITHLSSEVDAELDGDLLHTVVTQVYENRTASEVDCECLFPKNSTLRSVQLKINGKVIMDEFQGEILIFEALPLDKIELKVNFTETLKSAEAGLEMI